VRALGAPFPLGYPVTVKRAGGRTPMGDKIPGSEHVIEGCAWSPRMRENIEITAENRASTIEGLQLYGPPDSDILPDDEIVLPAVMELAGMSEKRRTYRVYGDVGHWFSPLTGWRPGFEVALERVT
jgi:hypothetical protein